MMTKRRLPTAPLHGSPAAPVARSEVTDLDVGAGLEAEELGDRTLDGLRRLVARPQREAVPSLVVADEDPDREEVVHVAGAIHGIPLQAAARVRVASRMRRNVGTTTACPTTLPATVLASPR